MTSMIAPSLALGLTLQPPTPTPAKPGHKQQDTSTAKQYPGDPGAGSSAPLAPVPALPVAPQSQPVAANPGNQGNQESTEDWRIVWFTGALTLVAILQWIAMLRQSKHMKDGLAETRASITEAGRSAKAMEGIASSLAANVTQLESVMAINRRMADTQERVMILQNRAYLQTEEWKVFRVVDKYPDQPLLSPNDAAITFFIRNRGQSPATLLAIRKNAPTVEFSRAEELDLILEPGHWVQQTIPFTLRDGTAGALAPMLTTPLTVHVEVDYADGFARRTKRFARTTWSHISALTLTETPKEPDEWLVYGGSVANGEVEHAETKPDQEASQRQPNGQKTGLSGP